MNSKQPAAPSRQSQPIIALIDELPLRRTSTVDFLRSSMTNTAKSFASVAEFAAWMAAATPEIGCVIVNVGGSSLDDSPAIGLLQQLIATRGAVPVVVLSDHELLAEVMAAFRHGARGFIPSNTQPAVAIEALRLILAGAAYFPASALADLRHARPTASAADRQTHAVTRWPRRQLAVLRLLGEGKANKEIARALGTEESTIKVHVWHIMRRLGTPNRTQAVLRARELGILVDTCPCTEAPSTEAARADRVEYGRMSPAAIEMARPGGSLAALG